MIGAAETVSFRCLTLGRRDELLGGVGVGIALLLLSLLSMALSCSLRLFFQPGAICFLS